MTLPIVTLFALAALSGPALLLLQWSAGEASDGIVRALAAHDATAIKLMGAGIVGEICAWWLA